MARLYADEDFDHLVVQELRRLGHDILTVQDAGQANRGVPDVQVLGFAVSENRAVLTFNRRDFIRLHHASPTHTGIVVCTRDADTLALASRIDQSLNAQASLNNALIRIYRPS
jgi:predicted nuclease of predicted toxin-antitoxin system